MPTTALSYMSSPQNFKFCKVELSVSLFFYDFIFGKKKITAICIFLQVILLVLINSDFNKKLEGSLYKPELQV